jgi:hypothetical protein
VSGGPLRKLWECFDMYSKGPGPPKPRATTPPPEGGRKGPEPYEEWHGVRSPTPAEIHRLAQEVVNAHVNLTNARNALEESMEAPKDREPRVFRQAVDLWREHNATNHARSYFDGLRATVEGDERQYTIAASRFEKFLREGDTFVLTDVGYDWHIYKPLSHEREDAWDHLRIERMER